jgi:hypothetical protein
MEGRIAFVEDARAMGEGVQSKPSHGHSTWSLDEQKRAINEEGPTVESLNIMAESLFGK